MNTQQNQFARFVAVIPFDCGEQRVVYDIPFDLWCRMDDACIAAQGDCETGGLLIGEHVGPYHARLTTLADHPEGTTYDRKEIMLPDDWTTSKKPDGFQGTWHTHPTPSNASMEDINHLLYMIRPDFWPLMIVLSHTGGEDGATNPWVYIGVSTPATPLIFQLEFEGILEAQP